MTEAQARQKIVGIMQGWIGLNEGNGSHMRIIDIYNGHTPLPRGYRMTKNDPWCATTVSAAAIAAEYTDIIPCECSCTRMIALFQQMGRWMERDDYKPAPGDYIFYDWNDTGKGDCTGTPEHVGMVEKVSGTAITVIEGNYKDSVKRRTLAVDGKYIRGYGIPDYAAIAASMTKAEEAKKQETTITASVPKSVYLTAQEVLDGAWGNGEERKTCLEAAGHNPAEVQPVANALNSGTLRVSVTASVLNVRRGPGTDRDIIGQLLHSTITSVTKVEAGEGSEAGWGKTASGWIALDHVSLVM